jgi:hypothetical protein
MKALLEYLARGMVGAPERVVVLERDIRGVQTLHNNIDAWREAPVWDQTSIDRATATWFHHLKEESTHDA